MSLDLLCITHVVLHLLIVGIKLVSHEYDCLCTALLRERQKYAIPFMESNNYYCMIPILTLLIVNNNKYAKH